MRKLRFVGVPVICMAAVWCGCKQKPTTSPVKPLTKSKETKTVTTETLTGKKVLLIIASKNFRDEELFEPKGIFEGLGAKTIIASSKVGTARGMLGGTAEATVTIETVKVDDYDAVVFVGGSGSSEYFDNKTAHRIAQDTVAKGKILGAICIAPTTLANAGVLKGKKATAYPSQRNQLKKQGAVVVTDAVAVDGKIITGTGPEAAKEFGQAIANALAGGAR